MGGRNAKVFSCASGGGEVDLSLKSTCVWKDVKRWESGNMGIWGYEDILDRREEGITILLQPVAKVLEVGSRFVKVNCKVIRVIRYVRTLL